MAGEPPNIPPFDPILSRAIDLATVLSEDDRREPGQQAMAMAWLKALERLVPSQEVDYA